MTVYLPERTAEQWRRHARWTSSHLSTVIAEVLVAAWERVEASEVKGYDAVTKEHVYKPAGEPWPPLPGEESEDAPSTPTPVMQGRPMGT